MVYRIPELMRIEKDLHDNYGDEDIRPARSLTFRVFEVLAPKDIVVLILGQDPYHSSFKDGTHHATGLAFSYPKGSILPGSSSLKNVFQELKDEYPERQLRSNPNLEDWEAQGVMLLNACLTVNAGNPGSHKLIWGDFVCGAIDYMLKLNPNIILLLWGSQAERLVDNIENAKKARKLIAGHPSNLNRMGSFMGCKHFMKVNKILHDAGKPEIIWV
jgi:uracil-DNA glycosylase